MAQVYDYLEGYADFYEEVLPVPYALWAPEAADFQVNRDLFVARNVDITGSTTQRGNATVGGTFGTTGAATFGSTVSASGAANLAGGATVGAPGLTVNANSTLNGNTTVNGDLTTNAVTARGDVVVGSGRPAGSLVFGNTGESRIRFPSNPFGGDGDFAEIVYTSGARLK
jgi:hypothetical protein